MEEELVVVFVLEEGSEEEDAEGGGDEEDEEDETYPPHPKIRRGLFSGMGGRVSSPARANKVKIKRQIKPSVQNK